MFICVDGLIVEVSITPRYIPRRRVVHLDLKGAPPKLTYLKNLFPLFASAGATTVLIEYEDMFPFKGDIRVAMISECDA